MASVIPTKLRPQFVNNCWRKPALSLRQQAVVRKNAISNHKYFAGADLEKGEWDPAWDKIRKPVVMREPKGKGHELRKPERVAKIEAALATMDDKIAEMRTAKRDSKPKTFLEHILKKANIL